MDGNCDGLDSNRTSDIDNTCLEFVQLLILLTVINNGKPGLEQYIEKPRKKVTSKEAFSY